jgi:hypothetical protein
MTFRRGSVGCARFGSRNFKSGQRREDVAKTLSAICPKLSPVKGIGFYSAAAQVIPIIAILLLVDLRLSTAGRRFYAKRVVPLSLGLLYVAEILCLAVLKLEADYHDVVFYVTLIAISGAFALVGAWLALYVVAARVLEHDQAED